MPKYVGPLCVNNSIRACDINIFSPMISDKVVLKHGKTTCDCLVNMCSGTTDRAGKVWWLSSSNWQL